MGVLKFFGSLVFAVSFLFGAASAANSQQPQTQSASGKSLGQQAVDIVLQHYGIDPDSAVPTTGKSLPLDGKWAIQKNAPDSCPHTARPCLRVIYSVGAMGVSCEWTILLGGEKDENHVLDVSEDTARYMILKSPESEGPVALSKSHPYYPPLAKMQHLEGTVRMIVHINETGHVDKITVVSGPTGLQKAAVDAVQTWTYKPQIVDANAVPVRAAVNVHFQMAR